MEWYAGHRLKFPETNSDEVSTHKNASQVGTHFCVLEKMLFSDKGGHLMPDTKSLSIASINKEENKILFQVDGCNVTVICAPQSNHRTYEQVKSILIGAILKKSTESPSKLDN